METETAPTGSSRFLNTVFFNDRGLRAGWRLLIYLGIIAVVILLLNGVLFLVTGGKPGKSQAGEITPFFTILGDGLFFLLMLLAAFIMSRIEHRSIGEYGLPLKHQGPQDQGSRNLGWQSTPGLRVLESRRQPVFRRLIVGYVFWGFLPLTIVLAIMRLFHAFSFGDLALHGSSIILYGAAWALGFLLVGLAEEYLLRGYALYTLADGIGFWPAAIVMAVLFGIGHSFNAGETRVGLIATVVFALFASVTLRLTGNLWLAVGAHAGWDWGQSFFYGVSDSGLRAKGHLMNPSFRGPVWLTGGTVGPEGSAVTLILWTVMIALFVIIYRRRSPALVVVEEKL
jgi:membrane protease YdiL (CAAX protease family)